MNSIDRRASVLHAFGKQRRIKRAVARLGLAGHELLRDLQIKIDMGKASRVGAALLDLADDVEVIAREAAAKTAPFGAAHCHYVVVGPTQQHMADREQGIDVIIGGLAAPILLFAITQVIAIAHAERRRIARIRLIKYARAIGIGGVKRLHGGRLHVGNLRGKIVLLNEIRVALTN